MDFFFILIGLGILIPLVALVVAIIAIARSGDLLVRMGRLERELEALRASPGAGAALGPVPQAPPVPDAVSDPGPLAEPASEPVPEPASEPFAPQPAPASPALAAAGPEITATVPTGRAAAGGGLAGLERKLSTNWLVWVGGVALALGTAFLVAYGIDQGWLTPATRVGGGFLFGLALVAGSEWLRRLPDPSAGSDPPVGSGSWRSSLVAEVVAGAGLFATGVSIWAAHGLYDMLGPALAFLLLAGLSLAAGALSLLHGRGIALLGVLGGYATPLIVRSPEPDAAVLFLWLAALTAGALLIARWRGWWDVAAAALILAGLWPMVWFGTAWQPGDTLVLAAWLLVMAATIFLITGDRRRPGLHSDRPRGRPWPATAIDQVALGGLAGVSLLLSGLVRMDDYGVVSLAALVLFCGAAVVVARRWPAFEFLSPVAAVTGLWTVATWHVPRIIGIPALVQHNPVLPPELDSFAVVSAGLALLFGVTGFLALRGARGPRLHALVSAGLPVLMLGLAWWRIGDLAPDLPLAIVAAVIACLMSVAAHRLVDWRAAPDMEAVLGRYVLAALSALALGLAMLMEQAWLTVALALQIAAAGWIDRRLALRDLRIGAGILAAVVLVRLCANPWILDYAPPGQSALGWVIWGYGLPAVCFWLAARWFTDARFWRLVALLEAGAIAFTLLLASFTIRELAGPGIAGPGWSFQENALHGMAWLTIALVLLWRRGRVYSRALAVGWQVLAGVAVALILIVQTTVLGPVFTGDDPGGLPLLNDLLLAWGVPAVLGLLIAVEARSQGLQRQATIAGWLAFLSGWLWLSLETVRTVRGGGGILLPFAGIEWWAMSAMWLVWAIALLVAGIRYGRPVMRRAAIVVAVATTLKAFLYDMSALTGIWRALSFIGLGLVLVGIGFLYQRLVANRSPVAPANGGGEEPAAPQPGM